MKINHIFFNRDLGNTPASVIHIIGDFFYHGITIRESGEPGREVRFEIIVPKGM